MFVGLKPTMEGVGIDVAIIGFRVPAFEVGVRDGRSDCKVVNDGAAVTPVGTEGDCVTPGVVVGVVVTDVFGGFVNTDGIDGAVVTPVNWVGTTVIPGGRAGTTLGWTNGTIDGRSDDKRIIDGASVSPDKRDGDVVKSEVIVGATVVPDGGNGAGVEPGVIVGAEVTRRNDGNGVIPWRAVGAVVTPGRKDGIMGDVVNPDESDGAGVIPVLTVGGVVAPGSKDGVGVTPVEKVGMAVAPGRGEGVEVDPGLIVSDTRVTVGADVALGGDEGSIRGNGARVAAGLTVGTVVAPGNSEGGEVDPGFVVGAAVPDGSSGERVPPGFTTGVVVNPDGSDGSTVIPEVIVGDEVVPCGGDGGSVMPGVIVGDIAANGDDVVTAEGIGIEVVITGAAFGETVLGRAVDSVGVIVIAIGAIDGASTIGDPVCKDKGDSVGPTVSDAFGATDVFPSGELVGLLVSVDINGGQVFLLFFFFFNESFFFSFPFFFDLDFLPFSPLLMFLEHLSSIGGSFIIPFPIIFGIDEGIEARVGTAVVSDQPLPFPRFLLFMEIDGISDTDGSKVNFDDDPFPIIPFRDCLSRK
jgi:hypothetical protein